MGIQGFRRLGSRGLGVRGLGLEFGIQGFKGLGFTVRGFRVSGVGSCLRLLSRSMPCWLGSICSRGGVLSLKQSGHQCRAMRPFFAACFAALVEANILQFDTLPVNSEGAWFGSGPMSLT